MGTVVRRPLFIQDLRDAWAYIAQDNPPPRTGSFANWSGAIN